MKITGIKTFFCGNNHYIRILTDEGISGIGEATLNTRQLAVEGVFQHLESVLVGQDPMRGAHIWQDIYRGTFWRGGPVLMSALAGVEMALWDIKGKYFNVPVYQLLGGKVRDSVPIYVNGWFSPAKTPDEFAEKALEVRNKRFFRLQVGPLRQGVAAFEQKRTCFVHGVHP